jgi:hypothetical protein
VGRYFPGTGGILKKVCTGQAVHRPGLVLDPGVQSPWKKTAKNFPFINPVATQNREGVALRTLCKLPGFERIRIQGKFMLFRPDHRFFTCF